jgi:hypothetical protein
MGVTVTGIDETIRMLRELRERADNLEGFLNGEAVALHALIDESWSTRSTPGGAAWAPERENAAGGSSLSRAHTVTAEPESLTLHVSHPAASFQYHGTRTLPGRNPTPFAFDGTPDPAWAADHAERLKAHLVAEPEGHVDGR